MLGSVRWRVSSARPLAHISLKIPSRAVESTLSSMSALCVVIGNRLARKNAPLAETRERTEPTNVPNLTKESPLLQAISVKQRKI